MNGYSTGWKFNGWFSGTADVGSAGGAGNYRNDANSVVADYPKTTWTGNIATETQAASAILVHGYNAIRLRFPMTSNDGTAPGGSGGNLTYPVVWSIHLIESNAEPDQTATFWMSTQYCLLMTTWPATGSVPTSESANTTDLFNFNGKPWCRLANGVRIIQGASAVSSLCEIPATNPTSGNGAYGFAGNTYSGVLGSFSSLQPHNIVATTGLPGADIYSDAAICPTYSPVLGNTNTTHAGEIYINNLAGAQYLLCIPISGWGYVPANTKYTPPTVGTTGAGKAKSVGVMYNLIQ
jgi:hypothetical protein